MGKYASKIVEVMQSWIGKKESDGSHKEIIDIYNGHTPRARGYQVKPTDSWCAATGSAAAIKLGYTDIIPTECSCGKQIELWKQIGCWVEDDSYVPGPGVYIYYDWDDSGKGDNTGWPEHVGVVEKVVNGVITVIEGNNGDAVKRRNIKVNAKNIRGYGVPKYDAEPAKVTASPNVSASNSSNCYPAYTGASGKIDEVLKAIGVAGAYVGSWKNRKPIASANGIGNYTGTAEQNTKLITLAKQGKLKKVGSSTTVTQQVSPYYPKYTGNSYGIDTVFAAIGVPAAFRGNWKNRKPVAAANGISNYTGKAEQNTKLISLAKQGKLKKA